MRIACPSCGAEYNVPDRLLSGAARTLRCSRCGTDFALPRAEAAAAPPPPAAAPEPAPESAPPPPTAEPPVAPTVTERTPVAQDQSDRALLGAWAASVLVVAGGAAAMLAFRAQLMAAWPPVTRLFAVLGLA
ncbi:zinc-ribbon domain-containing protein [Roseomonas fluvialis]|nr:zinc-ribbon domain-containing protein [Roseomonas fluvialis]